MGAESARGEREEVWARLLLVRWGVVCREVLEREPAVRWSEVAPVYARMELSGDVRRGEFLEGFGPIQYAAPETVEDLRERRDSVRKEKAEAPVSVVCGVDPVAFGLETSATTWIAFRRGEAVFELPDSGALRVAAGVPDSILKDVLSELQGVLKRSRDPLGRPRRVRVITLSEGRPIVGTGQAILLESAGFSRDGDGYIWRAL
jgi:ATP-dependent Lhr-like helicase